MMLMATLGPKASAIVEAARCTLQPTDADRARIEAALRARLGPAALPPDAVMKPPTAIGWRMLPGAPLGVCAIAGALFFASRPAPTAPAKPLAVSVPQQRATSAPASVSLPAPNIEVPETGPPTTGIAPASIPPASAARPQDRLLREVALLSRATSALSAGRAGAALKALDEHQREFPHGVLSEERRAAKAQALCSLGRVAQGRAEISGFPAQSAAGARATQACDAAAEKAQTAR